MKIRSSFQPEIEIFENCSGEITVVQSACEDLGTYEPQFLFVNTANAKALAHSLLKIAAEIEAAKEGGE